MLGGHVGMRDAEGGQEKIMMREMAQPGGKATSHKRNIDKGPSV